MMRRRQHTPRYLARRNTVTMRARALKRKRPKRKRSGVTRVLVTALAATLVLMLAGYGAYRLVKHLHQSPEYIVKVIRGKTGNALYFSRSSTSREPRSSGPTRCSNSAASSPASRFSTTRSAAPGTI